MWVPVRTPEQSIERYNCMLKLKQKGGLTLSAAFELKVDHNTIALQAPIAELQKVDILQYEDRGVLN